MSDAFDTRPLPGDDGLPAAVDEPDAIGASAWRSQVLRQARRLEDEMDRLPADQLRGVAAAEAHDRVAHAKAVALGRPQQGTYWRTFRDWWTGNAVETAWDDLQTAREQLMLLEPSDQVRAHIPSLQRRLASSSPDPAHDPHIAQLRSIASSKTELTADERAQVAAAHARVTAVQNDHSAARQFRNNLILWTAGLGVAAIVLASITSHGFRYLLVGAVAGLLTTAIAWRSLTHLSGPYSVSTAQAALKVSAGAASALLGVVLVRSGIVSGLHVSVSTAYGYAVVFGFSQQAFTQAVDNAAKNLGGT